GSFIRYAEVGRLSRTMGTLIENGIVVNDALNSVWGTVDNAILKSELMVASTEVRDGASLNYALRDSIFFPDMALSMIAVGEETGRLDQSFHKIADTYERRTDQAAKTMVSLLGPLVLVVIMVFVTLVVLAMILPIFQMDLSI
ncbi:MAG: type II secretion system F family protein, partial [Candidatus Omnitrophica bacterium]|nr:type II secretion system F family protein [Candidatus Omnitrophota bacterium]